MIARKSFHRLVIALCLWLPLQAIAGQWLHCAQLQTSLTNDTHPATTKLIANKTLPPCHQATTLAQQNLADLDQQTSPGDDIKSCKHCQFACHWHCVLLINNLFSNSLYLSPYYIPFKNPSPLQPLLSPLQKPPRANAAQPA